jgi:hypothetical protein
MPADRKIGSAAADAPFVFVGTVEQAGASSVAGAPADQHTGIVRVEQVVRAPEVVGLAPGATVTVRSDDSPPQTGERALYLADSWIYGDGIAVTERAKQPIAAAGAAAGAEAPQPDPAQLEALAQAPLKARAETADLIVQGRVVGLEPSDSAAAAAKEEPEVTSEHDPQWWYADIAVDDVLKGKAGNTVRVAFPGSTDVAWYGWPRPTAGQTGVFLLHQPTGPDVVKNAYVAPDPLDTQPHGTADHVRALAGGDRTGG